MVFERPNKLKFTFKFDFSFVKAKAKPGEPANDLPTAKTFRAAARRTAQLKEAAEVLAVLPELGEALHALMTGRYDLMHLIVALVDKLGDCDWLRIATLSFNLRNIDEMVALLDSGKVARLSLLCSQFFKDNSKEVWTICRERFEGLPAVLAASRNHCKVVTLAFRAGIRLALEGSANLRTNSNREQFCLVSDASLHEWHSAWIDEQVRTHEKRDKS
jgi:hypothetical protein